MTTRGPAPAARRGARRARRWSLVAAPILLLGAMVGGRVLDSSSGGAGGGIAELTLVGSAGSGLVEALTAVTLTATHPASSGALRAPAPFFRATATMAVDSVSTGDALVGRLDSTTWRSATLTLTNRPGTPSIALRGPRVSAYLLQSGQQGATGASGAGGPSGPYVELTIEASEAALLASAPTTTSLPPPTTLPKPAVQTCVPNPQKPVSPHSAFPLASYEVPTSGLIRQTSPTLADVVVGGRSETVAVFGDEGGWLYVVDAATCQLLPGWPQQLAVPPGQLRPVLAAGNRHAVIESTPALGFPGGPGTAPMIVVGAGSTWDNTGVGEEEAFNLQGQELWDFPVKGRPQNANGDFSSASFGPVVPGTGIDVVFGSWDGQLYVLDAAGNLLASYDNTETIWSSPALYRLPGEATDDVFVGLDESQRLIKGGCVGGVFAQLRYLEGPPAGSVAAGSAKLRGAVAVGALDVVHESTCQGAPAGTHDGQAVWSSPAIGEMGGRLVAAIGTSFYDLPYGPGTDRLYVYPVAPGGPFLLAPLWEGATPGPVFGSPAIGPVEPPGSSRPVPAVVDTSFVCPGGGATQQSCLRTNVSAVQAWVPAAASGALQRLWIRHLPGGDSLASPVLVPLRGEQADDVLVGSGGGLLPLDGGTGAFLDGTGTSPPQLAIHPACILYNTPAVALVTGSGPYAGWYAYELCSYGGPSAHGGGLFAYHLPDAPGAPPAWPMFRGDPTHSGVSFETTGSPIPPGDPVR